MKNHFLSRPKHLGNQCFLHTQLTIAMAHVGEELVALFAAVRALEIIAELKGVIKIKAHGFDEDCREVVERVLTAKDELGGEVSVLQGEVVFGHRF